MIKGGKLEPMKIKCIKITERVKLIYKWYIQKCLREIR